MEIVKPSSIILIIFLTNELNFFTDWQQIRNKSVTSEEKWSSLSTKFEFSPQIERFKFWNLSKNPSLIECQLVAAESSPKRLVESFRRDDVVNTFRTYIFIYIDSFLNRCENDTLRAYVTYSFESAYFRH